MIRHIFTMLWHQNRKYFIIAAEMAGVFIILLWSIALLFEAVKKYNSPGMLDTDNVAILGVVRTDAYYNKSLKDWGFIDNVMARMKNKDYISGFVESLNFTPYLHEHGMLHWHLSLASGEELSADLRAIDGDVENVFRPKLIEGRWFIDGERTEQGYKTAVVTADFAQKAKMEYPVGQTLYLEKEIYQIVGVVDGFKNNAMEESVPSVIFPLKGFMFQRGCSAWREFGVRVKPGYEEILVDDFYHEFKLAFNNSGAKDAMPLIYDSSTLKSRTMKNAVTELAIVGIPALFLLIFTMIGIVGVNLMDVKSRMCEFALRISVGATVRKIVLMVFWQNFATGFISLIPGVIIILLANDFAATALCAVGVSVIVVLLLAIMAVLYPAVLISRMNPAILLKEE